MVKLIRENKTLVFYIGLFLGGLFLRFLMLGNHPLREVEARWALQAWELRGGDQLGVGSRVGYLSFTSLAFQLLGGSEWIARIWPALIGGSLIWFPYLFREQLGERAALTAAVGLAVDPGLVTASRFAGSPLPALFFLLSGLFALNAGKLGWGVFLLGMAAFSGRDFWLGLLILWGVIALVHWFSPLDVPAWIRLRWQKMSGRVEGDPGTASGLALPLVGLALFASFFLRHYHGLTAWFSGFLEFLAGFTAPEGQGIFRLMLALVVYQPLPVLLGMIESIRGWIEHDRRSQLLNLSFLGAVVVLLLYPGRQTADLVWALLPLYGLAGLHLDRVLKGGGKRIIPLVLGGFLFVLSALSWMSFTGIIVQAGNTQSVLLQWVIILAAAALGAIAAVIVALEWSWETARRGLMLGGGTALLLYGLSALVGSAYLRPGDPRELWVPGPGSGEVSLLRETVAEISRKQTGRSDSLSGIVYGKDPVLRWVFRDYPNLKMVTDIDNSQRPQVIITPERAAETLALEAYLGQDFLHATAPGWIGPVPSPWQTWLAFREGILEERRVILWVRKDVVPGSELFITESVQDLPTEAGEQ
mgnify:CR=1 FL=1